MSIMKPVSETLNSLFISSFMYGCKIINKTGELYQHLYNTNEEVRYLASLSKYLYCLLISQHMEPSTPNWVSKSTILLNEPFIYKKYSLEENYSSISTIKMPWFVKVYDNIGESFNQLFSSFYNIYNNQYVYDGSELYIMKLINDDDDECYFIYQNEKEIQDVQNVRSNTKFLSIEYKHPKMKNGIELKLERSWFFVGNELFTPTFVLRSLQYQSKSYIFDSTYTITIVDSDINMIEFGNDKHILLTESGYDIVAHKLPDIFDDDYDYESEEIYYVDYDLDEQEGGSTDEDEGLKVEDFTWILPGKYNIE